MRGLAQVFSSQPNQTRLLLRKLKLWQRYFTEFNEIYEPDQYIGLWYQFEIVLMNKSEAQKFMTKVKSFGTLDFALLNKHI